MPLNAATYAEELAVKAGKPSPPVYGKKGKRVRGWKGFYGSVHDIVSCRRICIPQLTGAVQLSVRGQSSTRGPSGACADCQDGDLDLISDASISLAAHGQYM